MYLINMSPETSNITGYTVGLVGSYFLNRKYTFNSRQKRRAEMLRFLAVFVVAYVSNYLVLIILIHRIEVHEGVSQILAGLIYVIVSFVMNKYYVFKVSDVV